MRKNSDIVDKAEDIKNMQEDIKAMQRRGYSEEYHAMMLEHKKNLNKINKEGSQSPWEGFYAIKYLVEFLRFMKDYYTLGENVWGGEEEGQPSRLESLTKTLEYYDKWQGLENEYVKVIYHPETYETKDNGDGTVTILDMGCHCEYKYGSMKRTYRKLAKEQEKYKKLFFDSLRKYHALWWD